MNNLRIVPFIVALLVCCVPLSNGGGGGGAGGGSAEMCPPALPACPSDGYNVCEPGASLMSCCRGDDFAASCRVPAGWLSHACPGCADPRSPCAVDGSGAVVDCCPLGCGR